MGTSNFQPQTDFDSGIIYRAISELFQEIENRKTKAEFVVKCSYFEIYNENIIDLLDSNYITAKK